MTAPVVMVQGTASGVGKSVVTAGLCRLLRRQNLRVAPFKAQNMSNNAAVTADGREIGRSTAVQAEAAGVEPVVDMNPILLKPEADARSQVIVLGRVWGSISARDYARRIPELWPIVAGALDRLRAHYDVVIAEGAGSPAELNLRERDIANMRVARHTGAAVLLVGDIDRGGVFAQLLGTLDLLPPSEHSLVKGLIVNQFRGDSALFDDGVRLLEERSGLPVFGVVPMVRDLGLAEEDGAILGRTAPRQPAGARLRIGIIRLPRIANFDEFGPLAREDGVVVEYVDRPSQLQDVDMVVLPGTKATVADLAFVRQSGLAAAIVTAQAAGRPILGICGGYQMLGQAIHDPYAVESPAGTVPGLGLLGHETVFAPDKLVAQVRVRVVAERGVLGGAYGQTVEGYEIHAGRVGPGDGDAVPLLRLQSRAGRSVNEAEGAMREDGLVLGTSIHGLLEDETIRRSLIAWLRRQSVTLQDGPPPIWWSGRGGSSDPHDRWADVLAASLEVDRIVADCGIPGARRREA